MDQNGRLRTHIEGFDRMLEGGILQGHVVLVAGIPGTMKSSLTYYILHHNARESGQACVYVTLEQSRSSLLRQMEGMGMRIDDVRQNLHVLDLGLVRRSLEKVNSGEPWLRVFKGCLALLREEVDFSIIAIDSLDALEALSGMPDRRDGLFHLFAWFRSLNSTVFLISEASPDRLSGSSYEEGHLADGIVMLGTQAAPQAEARRTIRCVKMREVCQDLSLFTLQYSDGRFQAARAAGG